MQFLFLFILALSCTKNNGTEEKVLRLVSAQKVSGFDPALGGDLYTSAEMGKVYEGLYEFHPLKRPYELMSNLAQSLPEVSKDGLTYTFKLKKGVLFHDDPCFEGGVGRELHAKDVIYSLKRLADPKIHARGWWLYDDRIKGLNEWREKHSKTQVTNYDEEVEGLQLIDTHTFKVILKKPYPQLLYALAMPFSFVVAREAVNKYQGEFLNHPVGTGAFKLPLYLQSNQIIYTKNEKFREKYYPSDAGEKIKVPAADKIIVDIAVEAQPRWLAFQRGKLDILELPKDYFHELLDENKNLKKEYLDKGMSLVSSPMLDVTFFAFNHEFPLFKNLKLRQAISVALNREEENRLFYNDTSFKANGPIPPGMAGYRSDFENPYTKHNLELAKKLLKEAGYPEGKGLPVITVQTIGDTVNRQMLEFFTKCMAKIGIRIKTGSNTWPELVNKVSKKSHEMYTMAWSADYPDAENFLGLLYCPNKAPGSNGANYCNPKFDELFRKATILQDSPERTALYEKMNKMVALDVPWVFVFHRTKFYVKQGWVQNFNFMEFNHSQFQYLGVDKDKKKRLLEKF